MTKISCQVEPKKMKLCMYLVNYFYYVCAKFHPNWTLFSAKRLTRKRGEKGPNQTEQNLRDARPTLLAITKSWVKWNVGSSDFNCTLVNYLHYVCAKIHPNRTTFMVKGLARKNVVKQKRTNFTRCSTYTASNQKILSQGERRELRLCMYFS